MNISWQVIMTGQIAYQLLGRLGWSEFTHNTFL